MSYSEKDEYDYKIAEEGGAVEVSHWLNLPQNSKLKTSLETASVATQWIEPEQERLKELWAKAKNNTEREAREYQIEYVEKYLTRAEEIAKKRIEYFKTLKTQADFDKENALCSSDKHHWFEYYAWGYDPRARTPLSEVPFSSQQNIQKPLSHKIQAQ